MFYMEGSLFLNSVLADEIGCDVDFDSNAFAVGVDTHFDEAVTAHELECFREVVQVSVLYGLFPIVPVQVDCVTETVGVSMVQVTEQEIFSRVLLELRAAPSCP